jgi:CubicO group peptidase (beta-lactamase class C family)
MLYDEGKIQVTDTIGDIFADEIAAYGIDEAKWADITIHDVMKHKAGFKVGGLLDIDAQDATKWASQDYLELVLKAELDGKKTSRYTDAAYYLISRVVSKISGENLDIFLAKRLFNKTNCREFAFATCPQGYPIGATGLYIRSEDVVKLGRIYLDGGKYGETQIISKEWVDLVLEKGYELNRSGEGYAKGGMRGQYLYINLKKNVAAAWHSYDPNDETWPMGDTLHAFLK